MNVRRPCVYIPASRRHGTLYIGVTSDIACRAWEHRSDAVGGFVRDHRVHRLVFVEFHETMADAILREKRLKKWRRAWKLFRINRPLRQDKSWKGEWKCNLKPFAAIQRVRPPPGRGAARQPEASLAWETATSLVKRRQRMLKPCVSLEIMYPLRPSVWVGRGRCRQDR
jgi:putative endonuclease